MSRNIVVEASKTDDLLARAKELATGAWAQRAGDAVDELMSEFMPDWMLEKIELQLPLGSLQPVFRCTVTLFDGREKVRQKGEGDTPWAATLSALVGDYIEEVND